MLTPGTICRVYYNIHKHLLSIQTKTPDGWRVTEHLKSIQLRNCRFLVLKAGQVRARKEVRKNVHAFIMGEFVSQDAVSAGIPVTYNPMRDDGFTRLDNHAPIEYSDLVSIEGTKILAVLS